MKGSKDSFSLELCNEDISSYLPSSSPTCPTLLYELLLLVSRAYRTEAVLTRPLVFHILQGKKHQRALQASKYLQLTATGEAAQPRPLTTVAPRTTSTLPVSQPPHEQLAKKHEEKDEDIDLSCRFCGILLFEDVRSKLEHLETEAHRKKKGLPL